MPVRFENFDHSFVQNGKQFFKPSVLGRKIGEDIKSKIEAAYGFDPFVYHMRQGGHVAASTPIERTRFSAASISSASSTVSAAIG